jgi:hypothetical protein
MILRTRKDAPIATVRPRVTPHPDAAMELQRRIESLNYLPENGFHRDRSQHRRTPPR